MEKFDASNKITCLIEMALKGEIAWLILDSLIDGLTPNLESSRQIIRALLKEFETHQAMCLMKKSNDDNLISHEVIEINEDLPLTDEAEAIQKNYSKGNAFDNNEEIQSETGLINIQSDELNSANDVNNFSNEMEDNKSESEEELSKNIQLVEAFKGQLYTFVGGNSNRQYNSDSSNQSLDCDKGFDQSKKQETPSETIKIISGELPFECKTCNKRFKLKHHLKDHERIHTGEVPFKCKICSKRFKQIGHLKQHEIIHTGEFPYECKACKKRFNQISNLKRHERIHTGEVPFECKTCGKRFRQKITLIKHERIHTGEVPYECETCQKRFKTGSNLRAHEKIHFIKKPIN